MDSIIGILFNDWMALLKKHHFQIHPGSWLKALFITFRSLMNSRDHKKEMERFEAAIQKTQIDNDPVFIIGHWRSGTTFLHYLLSQDKHFAFTNVFEGRNPHTFLYNQPLLEKRLQKFKGQKRVMDNVTVRLTSPAEDEFALAIITLKSPLIGWLFPQSRAFYDRYMTLNNIPQSELTEWKEKYLYFIRKLTYKYNKQLLLKSPLNTARIRHLLDIFPNAKFIHIHRNPYDVFQSSVRLFNTAIRNSELIKIDSNYKDYIISHYKEMYDVYFKDLSTLNDKTICDVSFESLEKDGLSVVRYIYQTLGIDRFDQIKNDLKKYLDDNAEYKKNIYKPIDAAYMKKINENWERNFLEWGYKREPV